MNEICQLAQMLGNHFPLHLSRLKCLSSLLVSLVKVRTVSLAELAEGFGGSAKVESNEKRIHRFLKECVIPSEWLVPWIASKLPQGKWVLTLDRTNWEFGQRKINILVLAVVYNCDSPTLDFYSKAKHQIRVKKETPTARNGSSCMTNRISLWLLF